MNRFFRENLWRWKVGMQELDTPSPVDLDELTKSEWSDEFERLMRNRMVLGAIRYGKLHEVGKPEYDRVSSIFRRIEAYKETGNKEMLVDVANLCLLEFEECHHPNAHFASVDDGEHVERVTLEDFTKEIDK